MVRARIEKGKEVLGANGVEIRVLRKKSETLEDYFLKMTAEV